MDINLSCCLNGIKIDSINEKIELLDFEFILTPEVFNEKIFNASFLALHGQVSSIPYLQNPYLFLQKKYTPLNSVCMTKEDEDIIGLYANGLHYTIDIFVFCLWFIKDNSSSAQILYTVIPMNCGVGISNNNIEYSDCKGIASSLYFFSKAEIDKVKIIFEKYSMLCYHTNLELGDPDKDKLEFPKNIKARLPDFRKNGRIERAVNFVKLSRISLNLNEKIAFYICAIECLFGGKIQGEIVHQLSERVAIYIGKTNLERKNNYDLVKKAYSVRSNYFHGNTFENNNIEELTKLSLKIDELLRCILTKVILEDSDIFIQKDSSLDKSFKELLFTNRGREAKDLIDESDFLKFNDSKVT